MRQAPLHRQDDFVLLSTSHDHATGRWVSWVIHECNGTLPDGQPPPDGVRWCDVMIRGMCRWCGETIPEEIYGLWKLHNFDRLQEWGGAG